MNGGAHLRPWLVGTEYASRRKHSLTGKGEVWLVRGSDANAITQGEGGAWGA